MLSLLIILFTPSHGLLLPFPCSAYAICTIYIYILKSSISGTGIPLRKSYHIKGCPSLYPFLWTSFLYHRGIRDTINESVGERCTINLINHWCTDITNTKRTYLHIYTYRCTYTPVFLYLNNFVYVYTRKYTYLCIARNTINRLYIIS